MQQLYLTGSGAAAMADRLFHALNIRPAGFCLVPFGVNGEHRGEALHLLLPPSAPLLNDVPCRVCLSEAGCAVVEQTLDKVGAPSLLAALKVHTPMLLSGLSADMLACGAFRSAVQQCLSSSRPVVVAASEDAAPLLRSLTSPEKQLWMPVPDDEEGRTALLETLVTEAVMRF